MFKRCKKAWKSYKRGGKRYFLLFKGNFWPFPYHFMIVSWPFLAISLSLSYCFLSFQIVPNYFPIVFDHFLSFLLISFSSLVIFCPSLSSLSFLCLLIDFYWLFLTFISRIWTFPGRFLAVSLSFFLISLSFLFHLWSSFVLFCHSLSFPDQFWPFLTHLCYFWPFMVISCPSLTLFFSLSLLFLGLLCPSLGFPDPFSLPWTNLKPSKNSGELLHQKRL